MTLSAGQIATGIGQLALDAAANALAPRPEDCSFSLGGQSVQGWIYRADPSTRGILLFHTAAGVTRHEHRLARRLKAAGYSTMVVRYCRRTIGALLEKDEIRRRWEDVAGASLRNLKETQPGLTRIAVVGLSLGGYLAAWVASRLVGGVDSTVIYYGVYPRAEALLSAYAGPLLILQGELDDPEFVEPARRVAAQRPGTEAAFYQGGVHQFDLFQPRSAAARDAWARNLEFLGSTLSEPHSG